MAAGYTVVVWEGKLRVMMDVTSDARAMGYGRDQILEHGATMLQGTWAEKHFKMAYFRNTVRKAL